MYYYLSHLPNTPMIMSFLSSAAAMAMCYHCYTYSTLNILTEIASLFLELDIVLSILDDLCLQIDC